MIMHPMSLLLDAKDILKVRLEQHVYAKRDDVTKA